MKKIEVQMLLYTLTKQIMEVQGNMLNPFGIILLYKVVGWFDGQNIGVFPNKPKFNPFTSIYHVEYVYSSMYLVHVCKCITPRWVMDK